MNDDVIGTDNLLSDLQQRTLDTLLDMMVPAGDDGRMPSAREVGFIAWLTDISPKVLPEIADGLDGIDRITQSTYGMSLNALSADNREAIMAALREGQGEFLAQLTSEVMSCYYQHPRVLEGLGLNAGPPFPAGNRVAQGDLSLLEPVIARGKIYRNA